MRSSSAVHHLRKSASACNDASSSWISRNDRLSLIGVACSRWACWIATKDIPLVGVLAWAGVGFIGGWFHTLTPLKERVKHEH